MGRARRLGALAVVALVGLTSGCRESEPTPPTTTAGPTIPIGTDPLTNSGASSRTFTDPAAEVPLVVGETVSLAVRAPGGTGDRWVVSDPPDAAVAAVTGDPVVVPTVGPPGSPEEWAVPVAAVGPGRSTVGLELLGPDGAVVSTVTFTVVVS